MEIENIDLVKQCGAQRKYLDTRRVYNIIIR